jgi:hypothetical protein
MDGLTVGRTDGIQTFELELFPRRCEPNLPQIDDLFGARSFLNQTPGIADEWWRTRRAFGSSEKRREVRTRPGRDGRQLRPSTNGAETLIHRSRPSRAHAVDGRRPARQVNRRLLALLERGPAVREGKVEQIRGAIGAGGYENDLKLQIALDRLIDAIEHEVPPRPAVNMPRRACA